MIHTIAKKLLLVMPVVMVLSGCHHHAPVAKVPSDLQGDIPVRVTNGMTRDGYFVCIFSLGKSAMPGSWLDFRYASDFLRGGDSMEGRVKAGTYHMKAATCDVFLNVNSTVDKVITVAGPTDVVVTVVDEPSNPHVTPPGYTTVKVSGAYKTACIPTGEKGQIDLPCCHETEGLKVGQLCR